MIPLNIFEPTKIRSFTYYDRCAIQLDADEMKSVRVRISLTILATPVYRALNFKYPYSREFYGYGQAFFQNVWVQDFPINYTEQIIWDYWNQHGTIAHQMTSVLQKLSEFCRVSIDFQKFVLPQGDSGDGNNLDDIKLKMRKLTEGLTLEVSGGPNDGIPQNDYVNTFNHPINLLRFKFPLGTVFGVSIESWNPGNTLSGSSAGHPQTDAPFDPANPNGNNPAASDPGGNPEEPYGNEPPDSSPIDPALDPADFSNAPPPPLPGEGECLRVFGEVQIIGIDGSPRAIDNTYGPYPSGFSVQWEQQGQTTEPTPRPLYSVVVRGSGGAVVDIPITADLLRSATFERVVCPE